MLIADLAWMAIAAWIATSLRTGQFRGDFSPRGLAALVPSILVSAAVWIAVCSRMSLDRPGRYSHFPELLSRVLIAVAVFIGVVLALAFMVRDLFSRLAFIYFGLLLVVGFTAIRGIARHIVVRFRSRFAVRTVIIGSGRIAMEIANKITTRPELMRDLVGFLHPENTDLPELLGSSKFGATATSLSSVKVLEILKENAVKELILAGAEGGEVHTNRLISECRREGIQVCVVPNWYELYSSYAQLIDLEGLPLVKVEQRSLNDIDLVIKRVMDLAWALPLLVMSLPIGLLSALTIVLRGRRPFYSETRCGRNGETFRMYRLNIPRHSDGLGKWDSLLDRLSITELPQLWNVIHGEMSIVGPRPENELRVRYYSDWQRQRLAMKPGLTGLAQVQGLRDEHTSDEKARYDLQYINEWSPFLDMSLMLRTVWTLAVRIFQRRLPQVHGPESAKTVAIPLGEHNVDRAQSGAD
jgi:lipopolysaccharide/colanic/teichoic acid biosynthesis glycosyltransferase